MKVQYFSFYLKEKGYKVQLLFELSLNKNLFEFWFKIKKDFLTFLFIIIYIILLLVIKKEKI